MEHFFIKIDEKSVKANPDAGQTVLHELINTTGTFTIKVPHHSLENDNIKLISSRASFGANSSCEYVYMVFGLSYEAINDLAHKLREKFKKGKFTYTIDNHYEELHLMRPVPPYSFSHEPTEVQCCHCQAKFLHTELKDESDYDEEGGYTGRDNICPKCNKEDACELTFQGLESIILEKLGLPKMVVG